MTVAELQHEISELEMLLESVGSESSDTSEQEALDEIRESIAQCKALLPEDDCAAK